MNNELERRNMLASEAGRRIDAALAKLGIPAESPGGLRRRGRLLFSLDLTGSREASLYNARIATTAMFDAIKLIGSVAIKLIYYRGASECGASAWHDDPDDVSRLMQRLSCESGYSQIGRILRYALDEPERLDGLVFIGDHCEEEADDLTGLAAALGKRAIPLFIFHECADSDQRSLQAKPLFKRLAKVSGGVYCEFKPTSGVVLRELLTRVAAFSAGGKAGLRQVEAPRTPEARQLQGRLLLGPGSIEKGRNHNG